MNDSRPRPPLLERLGVDYFKRLSVGTKLGEAADAVHVLNADEREGLRKVERGTILRACVAGALSTIVVAVAEVLAQPLIEGDGVGWAHTAKFWAIVGAATAVASVLEILFLYWDGLRSVHRLSVVAGLDLFPEGDEERAVAAALARAALELPNASGEIFGVNPWREAARWRLVVASIAYKAKVSVTNLLVKMLVRRMLGRAVVRTWLPFVAVPITAAWNGVVAWLVMREARIRAMGPSASREMIDTIFEGAPPLSPEGRLVVLGAVASSILRTKDLHPNLVALMSEMVRRLGPAGADTIDSSALFLERLAGLGQAEQRIALKVVTVAAIVDGRLTRDERRLLVEARAACKLPVSTQSAERLRRAFVSGDPIPPETIRAIA